jgi:CMP-N-acetylneuraminic acid synthetase
LIPARQGSKRFPRKNVALLAGEPLVARAVRVARECPSLARVYVSTDDPQVAELALARGAAVVERPAELCTDQVVLDEVVLHFIGWLEARGAAPGAVCLMTPTAPLRTAATVERAIQLLWHERADFVCTVTPYEHNPCYALRIREGRLEPAFVPGVFARDRALLPTLYRPVAVARVGRCDAVKQFRTTFGPGMLPVVIDRGEATDVDVAEDLAWAEALLARSARRGASAQGECAHVPS